MFLDALSKVMGAVDRKLVNPVLSHCLLVADSQSAKLVATDLELQVSVEKNIDGFIYQDGHDAGNSTSFLEITFPAKTVYDFCRALQSESILELEELPKSRLKIKTNSSSLEVSTFSPSQFPLIQRAARNDHRTRFQISRKKLKELLESIQYAIAISDVRYYLNGVFLQLSRTELTCVATDGHRLSMVKAPVQVLSFDEELKGVIIPRRAILELVRLLDQSDDLIDFGITKDIADVRFEDLTITFKLIEGKFPDYKRVIPKKLKYRAIFDRDDLKSALATVAPILSNKDRGVVFHFSGNSVKLHATNSDQQEVAVLLKTDQVFDEMKIALNSSYVADFIAHIKGKLLTMEYLDPSVGVVFSQDSSGCYVVMPLIL